MQGIFDFLKSHISGICFFLFSFFYLFFFLYNLFRIDQILFRFHHYKIPDQTYALVQVFVVHLRAVNINV